jgi:hypothetical protein
MEVDVSEVVLPVNGGKGTKNDTTPDSEAITMEGNMGRVNLMLMFGDRLHVVVG